jgi:hypothetical protein
METAKKIKATIQNQTFIGETKIIKHSKTKTIKQMVKKMLLFSLVIFNFVARKFFIP